MKLQRIEITLPEDVEEFVAGLDEGVDLSNSRDRASLRAAVIERRRMLEAAVADIRPVLKELRKLERALCRMR